MKTIKYNTAKDLLNEGDVVLFKKSGWVGWFISVYTGSPYSHIGLISFENDKPYVLEFREFVGSRKYPLDRYVEENPERIDVFRVSPFITIPTLYENGKVIQNSFKSLRFTADVSENITNEAKRLIGKPYSWTTIYRMAKLYVPFIRLKQNIDYNKNGIDTNSFVCSTLITYTYRKYYLDPVPFLPDSYTTPGDIARSAIFHYLFTITG